MTTIQDNVLGHTTDESVANGTEAAPVLRVRAPRNGHVPTAATAEDIKLHQEVRARFRARLDAIKEEEAQILAELGERPKAKARRVRGTLETMVGLPGQAEQLNDDMTPIRQRAVRKTAAPKAKKAKESKAVSASSEKDSATQKAVLTFLKNSDEPLRLAAIAEGLKLDKGEVRRHLGNLREAKKVKTEGEARGTTYEIA